MTVLSKQRIVHHLFDIHKNSCNALTNKNTCNHHESLQVFTFQRYIAFLI